ncbi:hypothetical protein WG66_009208 [Moniliophthora roreri]|nr:hypothetical protein WG66_009208 [Moniliophthora roreri]
MTKRLVPDSPQTSPPLAQRRHVSEYGLGGINLMPSRSMNSGTGVWNHGPIHKSNLPTVKGANETGVIASGSILTGGKGHSMENRTVNPGSGRGVADMLIDAEPQSHQLGNFYNPLPSPTSPTPSSFVPRSCQNANLVLSPPVAPTLSYNHDTRPQWIHQLPTSSESPQTITQHRAELMFCANITHQGYSCMSLHTVPSEVASQAWEAVEMVVKSVLDPLNATPVPMSAASQQETVAQSPTLVYPPSPNETPPEPEPEPEPPSIVELKKMHDAISKAKFARKRLDDSIRSDEEQYSAAREAEKESIMKLLTKAHEKLRKKERQAEEAETRKTRLEEEVRLQEEDNAKLKAANSQITRDIERARVKLAEERERADEEKKGIDNELDELRQEASNERAALQSLKHSMEAAQKQAQADTQRLKEEKQAAEAERDDETKGLLDLREKKEALEREVQDLTFSNEKLRTEGQRELDKIREDKLQGQKALAQIVTTHQLVRGHLASVLVHMDGLPSLSDVDLSTESKVKV